MLGLADRALVIDLFDEVMARRRRRGAGAPQGRCTTSAPIRPWCSRTSPPSPTRHPPQARAGRRRGRGADRGGAHARHANSPASCRSACSPAPGRCCSRASRRRSAATAAARRRRHGDRPPRPRRRSADAGRGGAGAARKAARSAARRPQRAGAVVGRRQPPAHGGRRQCRRARAGACAQRPPHRRRADAEPVARIESFADIVALAGAETRTEAQARARNGRAPDPLRAGPDRDRRSPTTRRPALPANCRGSSRNGPARAG